MKAGIRRWAPIVAALLPGDVIHHQAPSLNRSDSRARVEAIDEANAKRRRKAEKRKP